MTKSKRILFAISNLTYGGIQTQALILAKEYQNQGAQIFFFWHDKLEDNFVKNELINNNFKIIDGRFINDNFWKSYSWKLNKYIPLIKTALLIRWYRIDYVIPYQNKLCYFLGSIHKYSGVKKTIFHIRNTVLEKKPKKNWLLNCALKNNPTIIANSNHARIKFKKIYGDKYDLDMHTIYNAIKIRKIDKTINWKKFFNVEEEDFIVTVIANFFNEKDYLTVFKAWKLFLDKSKSNSKLLIAGDEGIRGRRLLYEKEIKSMGLENHVIFLGRTPHNIELLSITDCNILSSKNEGLPNSVIETLAMGKPFLGTDIDGIKEVVGEAYPIPLFKKGDFKALQERILKIYNQEYDLKAVQSYSLERFKLYNVKNLIKNYSEVIGV